MRRMSGKRSKNEERENKNETCESMTEKCKIRNRHYTNGTNDAQRYSVRKRTVLEFEESCVRKFLKDIRGKNKSFTHPLVKSGESRSTYGMLET